MEHGASERLEEQSQAKITIKIEVEEAPQSATYGDIEINMNDIKKEPGLADLVMSEPGLSIKMEAAEDSWQDSDVQHSVQAASTPAIVASMNVSAGDADLRGVLKIKEEPGAIEIGPTVLQHAVTQGRTNQLGTSVVKQEYVINDDDNGHVLCSGEKELTKAEWSEAQHSKATQPEQRAQSRPYRCDKCLNMYKSKLTLYNHRQRIHGTGSHECTVCNLKYKCKDYLDTHVRDVHSKQQYECTICKQMYKSKRGLREHIARCHGRGPTSSTQQSTRSNFGKGLKSKWNCPKGESSSKCTRLPDGDLNAVATSASTQQRNVVMVKEEPADGELELGPVVFQHMDCNFRSYKKKTRFD